MITDGNKIQTILGWTEPSKYRDNSYQMFESANTGSHTRSPNASPIIQFGRKYTIAKEKKCLIECREYGDG